MISAYTATIPERLKTLSISIASMLPQVDCIQVVLNNFKTVPQFLKHPKIACVFGDNSLEDGSRFKNITTSGYVIVFDDDIEYPSDYVQTMIDHCKIMNGIVAPMGKVLKPRPVNHYYKDIQESYKTFQEVKDYHKVDVPGACGILWNADHVKMTEDIITPEVHHSDICVGKWAKENGVPCYVVPHAADWLKNLLPMVPKSPTIFGKYRNNDKILTDFVNMYL